MKVLTVSELTGRIKSLFENDILLANLWVKGEISNFKQAASGHIYLTLKDNATCIKTVMFRSRARFLNFVPENGMAVRVRGYVTVFERDGQYQLYAEEMLPDGAGELHAALELMKKKLASEGLFDLARKKPLPRFPSSIGIVTSPTGAAIRDMLNILTRRWPLVKIYLAPVTVQGETAPQEIARAINLFNRAGVVDLLIVGRGGGSLEELWAFNTEEVARSISSSNIPVISAVGHETDFTIADMVADLRAPTPSAAAEIAVPDRSEIRKNIVVLRVRMIRSVKNQVGQLRQRLFRCRESRVMSRPVTVICDHRRQLIDWHEKRIRSFAAETVRTAKSRLGLAAGKLDALSPLATLARGYSYTTGGGGIVLRDASQVSSGDRVTVHLHRGALECLVKKAINNDDKTILG